MVRVFGAQVGTEILDNRTKMTFEVPAIAERRARSRAKRQMQGKGFTNVSVDSSKKINSDETPPGTSMYRVEVTAPN